MPNTATTTYPSAGDSIAQRVVLCATCVIRDEAGRVLLHRRSDNGLWALPGGAMEPGETAVQTACREAFEETGYHVRVIKLLSVDSDPSRHQIVAYPDGNVNHNVSITVECVIDGPDVNDPAFDHETLELGWFSLDNLPDDVIPPHKLRLEELHAAGGTYDAAVLR